MILPFSNQQIPSIYYRPLSSYFPSFPSSTCDSYFLFLSVISFPKSFPFFHPSDVSTPHSTTSPLLPLCHSETFPLSYHLYSFLSHFRLSDVPFRPRRSCLNTEHTVIRLCLKRNSDPQDRIWRSETMLKY